MKLKVTPIINVVGTHNGQVIILPFQQVEVTDEKGTRKLLVNYTFGKVHSDEGRNEPVLVYESPMGSAKEKMLEAIEPIGGVRVYYFEGDTEAIVSKIRGSLLSAPNETKFLFVWDRKGVDDVPFYEALDLAEGGVIKQPPPKPAAFGELGYKVRPPFKEIPLSEVWDGEEKNPEADKETLRRIRKPAASGKKNARIENKCLTN